MVSVDLKLRTFGVNKQWELYADDVLECEMCGCVVSGSGLWCRELERVQCDLCAVRVDSWDGCFSRAYLARAQPFGRVKGRVVGGKSCSRAVLVSRHEHVRVFIKEKVMPEVQE